MRYYFIRIYHLASTGEEKRGSVMAYDNRFDAEKKFYTQMGTDMDDDTISDEMCIVFNSTGATEFCHSWTRPTPEPTPELQVEE